MNIKCEPHFELELGLPVCHQLSSMGAFNTDRANSRVSLSQCSPATKSPRNLYRSEFTHLYTNSNSCTLARDIYKSLSLSLNLTTNCQRLLNQVIKYNVIYTSILTLAMEDISVHKKPLDPKKTQIKYKCLNVHYHSIYFQITIKGAVTQLDFSSNFFY